MAETKATPRATGSETDAVSGRQHRLGLGSVALALWAQAESRRLAGEFDAAGVRALLLKGPDLQARLYGTPAAYQSGDVDILVPRAQASAARELLARGGWTFDRSNGVLWWVDAAAAYVRDGFCLDLHWGVHAARLPAWTLRSLERSLWRRAHLGPSGMLEPDAESLLVFLAVNVVGHNFGRPQWQENVTAAAELVEDWSRVWAIARTAKVEGAVRAALEGRPQNSETVVLDGPVGRAIWVGSWALRGHFLPRSARDRLREAMAMRRGGFASPRATAAWRSCTFAGLELRVAPGVFEPRRVTEEMLDLASDLASERRSPVVVDVGTGSGAVALAFAHRRPEARMHATDVSPRALRCARENIRRLRLSGIGLHLGSVLDPLPTNLRGRVDVVMSNLPYVPRREARDVDWGAPISTVEGSHLDGLGMMRELARQAQTVLRPGGWLVFQVADRQFDDWTGELRALGYEPTAAVQRRPGHAVVGAGRWVGAA
ncbi:MAG: nucleotidyltransferase family protein [Actinobacteria bacterium]|nr:nucleotidyltransferase family protein [Actinomycetota bacterium]